MSPGGGHVGAALLADARAEAQQPGVGEIYLAFSVPVVIAGVATTHFGLYQTAVGYSAVLAVLAAAAVAVPGLGRAVIVRPDAKSLFPEDHLPAHRHLL